MKTIIQLVWIILTLPFFLLGLLAGIVSNGVQAGYAFMDEWVNS